MSAIQPHPLSKWWILLYSSWLGWNKIWPGKQTFSSELDKHSRKSIIFWPKSDVLSPYFQARDVKPWLKKTWNWPWSEARRGRSPPGTWSCRPWRADRVWWRGSIPSRPCRRDLHVLRDRRDLHDLKKHHSSFHPTSKNRDKPTVKVQEIVNHWLGLNFCSNYRFRVDLTLAEILKWCRQQADLQAADKLISNAQNNDLRFQKRYVRHAARF